MAVIREVATDRTQLLEPEHMVGRAPSNALRLDKRYVSTHHACLRFAGDRWEIKDLGSRNGTFVNRQRVATGRSHPLHVGSKIAFGKLDEEWELIDDALPRVTAIPIDGAPPLELEGEILALPSSDNPRATIYRSHDGWLLEQTDSSKPVANHETFEVDGRVFRFSCPVYLAPTTLAELSFRAELSQIRLSFGVSSDEEHIELKALCGVQTFQLGSRAHNYLLVILGRRRLADAAAGLSEASCGWVSPDDYPHDPAMAPARINLDVLRIRRQFAAIGVIDAPGIIERRMGSRQLRIGIGQIEIASI